MSIAVQPYLFHQIGLDSGSLTILGSIVHSFAEPGEYRGVCLRGDRRVGVFYLKVEKGLATNQVNIDLAALDASPADSCRCAEAAAGGAGRFVLGANGYAVFHVSGGPGGFAVHVGRAADAPPEHREFDSVKLQKGDLFAATILRPGVYAVSNLAHKAASLELDVAYPRAEKKPFQPPAAVRIKSSERGFDPPGRAEIIAMQGCIFACAAPSRIKIELKRPYDPPTSKR